MNFSLFTPIYLRTHVPQHIAGGIGRWCVWYIVTRSPWLAALLAMYNQSDWELMQREYSNEYGRIYPWLSVAFDLGMTAVGVAAALGVRWLSTR